MGRTLDRRRTLALGAAALAASVGLGSYVSAAFLRPLAPDRRRRAIVVGYPEDIADDGLIVLGQPRIVVGRTADGFFALSTVCPHLGCVVRWLADEGRFHCPCHGSKFAPDGAVLNGPASQDLVSLAVGIDEQGRLVVDPDDGGGAA
jgi:Rieske Fe-S protein